MTTAAVVLVIVALFAIAGVLSNPKIRGPKHPVLDAEHWVERHVRHCSVGDAPTRSFAYAIWDDDHLWSRMARRHESAADAADDYRREFGRHGELLIVQTYRWDDRWDLLRANSFIGVPDWDSDRSSAQRTDRERR